MMTTMRATLRLVVAVGLTCVVSLAAASPDQDTDAEALFARTLYLVRHGAYDGTQKADPETGPGLTALGIAQARLVAARLRSLPVHFSLMTSSTMTRAKETAAVIHQSLPDVPMQQNAALSECTPPSWNPAVAKEITAREGSQCQSQLDEAFKTYFVPSRDAEESDIFVAHGNVIRLFVTKALGVDTKAWIGMSVAHASLTIIRVKSDGSMSVLSVGDVGHIPPNLQSWGGKSDPQLVVPSTSVR